MTNAKLRESEVVLYQGDITAENAEFFYATMTFTNERLIFQYKKRTKAFQKKELIQDDYAVTDIKVYNNIPQIKIKGNYAEIFLKDRQICLRLYSGKEAKKFHETVTELFTGMSKVTRNAEKIKNSIHLVNDTLGIDTVSTAADVLSGGLAGGVKSLFGKGKLSNKIANAVSQIGSGVGKSVSNNRVEQPKLRENTLDDKIGQIKKYKELLDAGIITEEEFNTKKKDILEM